MKHDVPELYHLLHDPSEKHNVAKDHAEVLARITKEVQQHRADLRPVTNQLER